MRLFIAILWVVAIAILHAIPGSDIPETSLLDLFHLDKFIHAILFLVGFYLFATALVGQQKKGIIRYIVIAFIVYGMVLEVLQGLFFVERSADALDWLADTVGVFLGLWVFKKFPFVVPTNSAKKD
jgi:VanZ family protein